MAQQPGPGVDAAGVPVIDPTQNVLDLVQAAIQRQDDLREADGKTLQAESVHLRELMALRADYEDRLRKAESRRIDAIRAVDVDAVRRATEVAELRAATLQAQVQAAAEAMRTTQASASQSAAEALANAIKPLADALQAVQQQQFLQAGGKAQVVESRANAGETRLNLGAILGGVSVFLVLVFGISTLVITLSR
jgi:hypothetical protein